MCIVVVEPRSIEVICDCLLIQWGEVQLLPIGLIIDSDLTLNGLARDMGSIPARKGIAQM